MSFNVFYTEGRLGGDPEFKISKTTKKEYCIFSLAYQYRRRTKPHWFPCHAHGKTCEIIKEIGLSKGDLIHLRASLYSFPQESTTNECRAPHLYLKVYSVWILARARTTESKHFEDVEQPKFGPGTDDTPFA